MIMAIPFAGGLALFLLSLVGMSRTLGEALGPRTRSALAGASVAGAFLSGAGVTALLQSSTLVTVTMVGLVNAGAMGLAPAFAAVLGANVGTTVTAQIAGLRPTWLGWAAAEVGAILLVWGKAAASRVERDAAAGKVRGQAKTRAREAARRRSLAGGAFLGFSGIVFGLDLMAQAMAAAADSDMLRLVLTMASKNNAVAALVGALVTAAAQSSALVSSLLVQLTREELIGLPGAVCLMIGSNVGTCVTALVASIPADREARLLARANMIFNAAGALLCLPLIGPFCSLLRMTSSDLGVQLANAHTIFNIATAAVVLPFSRQFVMLVSGRGKGRLAHYDYSASHLARNRPGSY